ncbi:MAG: ABC transporter permease [Thermomicrobiaceae bacterium]
MTTASPPRELTTGNGRLRSALSTRTRPPRANALSASITFGWRAVLKIKHVPEQLFDVTMFPLMFVLMFTYLFGGALAGSPGEYLQFLAPGILVQSIVMITIYTGTVLNNDLRKGIFDRFRSMPIWRASFLVGALMGDFLRYTIASTVVLGVAAILGFRPEGGLPGIIAGALLVMLFSFSLSWIWTMLSMFMRTQESLMFTSFLVMFPLTFVSNIFVDPETMPSWLEAFVDVNPISYLTTATRGLMAGDPNAGDLGMVFLSSAALVIVFAPLTMYFYNRKE